MCARTNEWFYPKKKKRPRYTNNNRATNGREFVSSVLAAIRSEYFCLEIEIAIGDRKSL